MKKYLFLPILLVFLNCTTFRTSLPTEVSSEISREVTEVIVDLKEVAKINEYEKLKEFFLPTFKNNIIVNNVSKYDLSRLNFVFSDVNVISNEKATNMMVINYGSHSNYYRVTWRLKDGQWKISDVAEKK